MEVSLLREAVNDRSPAPCYYQQGLSEVSLGELILELLSRIFPGRVFLVFAVVGVIVCTVVVGRCLGLLLGKSCERSTFVNQPCPSCRFLAKGWKAAA